MQKISLIAAIATNRALGKGNKLIYAIPDDLKRFKKITSGHPIIMGRKTFESIGRPLPNRTNIVVTSNKQSLQPNGLKAQVTREDIKIANSLEEAIQEAKDSLGSEEIFIIGGGQIFEQSINLADKLYLTVIEDNPEADVFFPDYSEFKRVVFEENHEYNGLKYKFLDLEKP